MKNENMVKPTSTSAIAKATDRPWDEWIAAFDAAGAREMNHVDIAKQALKLMPESVEQKEWWAQGVSVAYEQHAGLRVPGQSSTGGFQTSTSKTFHGDKDAALQAWLNLISTHTEFNGVDIKEAATTSETTKWRYWRVQLVDGSRVNVNISDKPNAKASIAVEHTKLASSDDIEKWRPYWKELLSRL